MKTRVISACVLIVLVAACFIISPFTRMLFLLVATVLGLWEMCRALGYKDFNCPVWVLYAYALAAGIANYCGANIIISLTILFLAVFLIFLHCITKPGLGAKGVITGLAVLMYPLLPFAVILKLSLMDNWVPVFLLACISTWLCDAFALFGGKWFGKNKLAPLVSPKKTVEGSLTGAAASVVAGIILYFVLKGSWQYSFFTCVFTALIASSFGQVGDLAASLIKRMTGIKDYSNLIPGHGGVMDRVDSLLFSIPVTYICLYLF